MAQVRGTPFVAGSIAAHLFAVLVVGTLDPPSSRAVSAAPSAAVVDFDLFTPEPEAVELGAPEPTAEATPAVRRAAPTPTPSTPQPPPTLQPDDESEDVVVANEVSSSPRALAANPFGDSGAIAAGSADAVGAKGTTGGGISRAETGAGMGNPGAQIRAWVTRVQRAVLARALRDYPRAARRAGLEGNVLVAMAVNPGGRIAQVEVSRSSGHERLDRAAIVSVETVGQLPPPPASFSARGRPLLVPIAYRLR